VVVVDGSSPELFRRHRAAWPSTVLHLPVDPGARGRNGKVGAVLTGARAGRRDVVVIADDDVRYDRDGLRRVARLLEAADLVRPQNYFDPLPWHARWDTARTLVNRAFAHDYPGTLGVRRAVLGCGYDGDSLFENLELIRTVEAAGGRVVNDRSLYIRRLPPSAAQFRSQRVRQAYDSFAQPSRLAIELSVLPVAAWVLAGRRICIFLWAALGVAATAEVGRRRDGGTTVFPWSSSLLAPGWVAERALCAWLAVWLRVRRGGIVYAGATLTKAANSKRVLRRRLGASGASGRSGRWCAPRAR
jgi:Glycosyl transferase family 21